MDHKNIDNHSHSKDNNPNNNMFSVDDIMNLSEREWLSQIYIGDDVKQFTFRAVLTGMLIGSLLGLANLYLGLTIGWSVGMSVTAAIIAWAIFKFASKLLPFTSSKDFTILENNTMQTSASTAAYMAGAVLIAAIPALIMLTVEERLPDKLVDAQTYYHNELQKISDAYGYSTIQIDQGITQKDIVKKSYEDTEHADIYKRFLVQETQGLVFDFRSIAYEMEKRVRQLRTEALKEPNKAENTALLNSLPPNGYLGNMNVTDLTLEKVITYARNENNQGKYFRWLLDEWNMLTNLAWAPWIHELVLNSEEYKNYSGLYIPYGLDLTNFKSSKKYLQAWVQYGLVYQSDDPSKLTERSKLKLKRREAWAATLNEIFTKEALKQQKEANLPWWAILIFILPIGILGLAVAVPMKKAMINVDKLPFPGGIACAETLHALHTGDSRTSSKKAISLFLALFISAILAVVVELTHVDPLIFTFSTFCIQMNIGVSVGLMWLSVGVLIGVRVSYSLVLGGVISFFIMPFVLENIGEIPEHKVNYYSVRDWLVWGSVTLMVTSGLTSFLLRAKVIFRAFRGLSSVLDKTRRVATSDIEVPLNWFVVVFVIASISCVWAQWFLFGISWWMGIIAILMSSVLAIIATRVGGETGIIPIGPMGKITQLTFGAIQSNAPVINLMTASVTAGAANQCSDMMNDFKAGYLVGASPKLQYKAQIFGLFAGICFMIPIFLFVAENFVLGGDKFSAPAAIQWKIVADLLKNGISSLTNVQLWSILIGAILGIGLSVGESFFPKKFLIFLPSGLAIGIGMYIPFFYSINILLGAIFVAIWAKLAPEGKQLYAIPIASGVFAGEPIMSMLLTFIGV